MKTMILAAFAALALGIGAANAQSLAHGAPANSASPSANQYNWLAGGGG